MSHFKSATNMSLVLINRGMEPSKVHSLVSYEFGFAPDMKRINKMKAEYDRKVERFKNKKLNDGGHKYAITDDGHKAAMRRSNDIFVRALWRELNMIQRRLRHG